ncbi:MAG TPA: SDR family oxidoreductase [Candidatus Binatia bacterium]|nr:SDR family oxidoreductase [Candidatus Binatia bacterium]
MDLGLTDRVAIVTGGSYGIGRAVAQSLLHEGARVAICARNADQLERTAKELGSAVLAVQADTSKTTDITTLFDKTLEKFGKLDILINNAGGTHLSQLLDLPDEAWQENIDVNLFGVIRCSRLAIPHMRKQQWGRIINISSIFGKQPGIGMIDYNATKAAVISLTKTLADELAKDNVLVNAVCPGPVRTPLWENAAKVINPKDPEGMMRDFATANIPIGRFGWPEEVASLVTFLASERASFITGAAYDVDGGMVKYMV